jgi:hypothetical protein
MNQPALKKHYCTRSQIRGYRYLLRIDDCGRILRNALRDRTAVQCRYHYGTYSSNVNTLSWATSLNQLSSEFAASDNGKWTRTCVCLTISTGYSHEFLTKGWIRRIRHVVCWYRDGTYSINVNTLSWSTPSNQLSSELAASDNGKWTQTCVCLTISTGYSHEFLTTGWIRRIRYVVCRYLDFTYSSYVNTLSWATPSNQLSSELAASDNGKWTQTCVCLTISTGYSHEFLTTGSIRRIRHVVCRYLLDFTYSSNPQELPLYRLVFAYNARIYVFVQ